MQHNLIKSILTKVNLSRIVFIVASIIFSVSFQIIADRRMVLDARRNTKKDLTNDKRKMQDFLDVLLQAKVCGTYSFNHNAVIHFDTRSKIILFRTTANTAAKLYYGNVF